MNPVVTTVRTPAAARAEVQRFNRDIFSGLTE
jgi:hypothetical protein